MASFSKHIAFFFLLLLSSSLLTQARESKFFSKIFHLGSKISPLDVPTPTPIAAPAPTPVPAYFESQDPYYGLYGQGSGMLPPEKETVSTSNTPTTTTSFENDILADETYETGYERNNYNNNGYTTSNYNDNGYSSNYNNNGYETERQGLSDTRFVEGGKYYYDVKNENYYPNGYESSGKETTKNEGYYGITENSNEFNSMEGFQNKEEYQESQEEYVP